ncbi:MAG: polysaccharide biosynthesis C-terminal domain-containing protein, partial [Melioribacteraceae bacterium]|nr:polysaccharide biosynthesis C-terminal domain-containing protein [Melioribacteraceae bacterium]
WQPFFLTNAKEENAKKIFSKVLSLFLIFSSLIWIILSLFIDNLARIEFFHGKTLIGQDYLVGIYIVPVVLLSFVFYGLYINFIAGIYLEEKTKYLPLITGIGAVVNIISNLLLVPQIGIMGGALSTLFSYVLMSIGIFIVSQRFYKINYEYDIIFKVLGLILFISIIYYYLYFFQSLTYLYKIALLILYITLMLVMKVVKANDLKTTLKLILNKK